MDNTSKTIDNTAEAWETGALGRDETFAQRAPEALQQQVEDAAGMQAISIRLDKSLIEDFKHMAKVHGVGYQPLMRDALKRFADAEMRRLVVELHNAQIAALEAQAKSLAQAALEEPATPHQEPLAA